MSHTNVSVFRLHTTVFHVKFLLCGGDYKAWCPRHLPSLAFSRFQKLVTDRPPSTSSVLPPNQEKLILVRDSIRSLSVEEHIVKRTLGDMLLAEKGLTRTDVFCVELEKLMRAKGEKKSKNAVDCRLSSQELGQICLLTNFQDVKKKRNEATADKRKKSKKETVKKTTEEVQACAQPVKRGRGRPKKVL